MLVSEIQSRVKNLFGDTAGVQLTDLIILDWVNNGQMDIARKTECIRASVSGTATAGQSNYAIVPADFIRPIRATYLGYSMKKVTRNYMNQNYPDRDSDVSRDTPMYYWIDNITGTPLMYVYPTPVVTTVNGFILEYISKPTVAAGGASSLVIPDQYYEDIVRYCMWQAFEMDEQIGLAESAKKTYIERLLETMYDQSNEDTASYPAVTALPGDY